MADNNLNLFNWQAAINETFNQFSQQVINFAPQILASLLLLLFGWLVAKALSVSTNKLVQGFDSLFKRVTKVDSVQEERLKNSYALIISKVVFWVVMLFFVAVAANILGWEMFSGWMDSIVNYLPGLLTGLVIIMAGFLVSNLSHAAIITATLRAGMTQNNAMARAVQVVILFSAIIIGVEQIGLNVDFLSNIIVVIAGTLLLGASLAFAFGARTLVANIIGAQYTRKHCRAGEIMKIGDVQGEILEVTQSSIILDTGTGRAVIPAKLFQEQISVYSGGIDESGTTGTGEGVN
ncbi:MAG: hypothetical protein RLZZ385_1612 [Pseudomonadota bacterium]|jgi:hypothetical protein